MYMQYAILLSSEMVHAVEIALCKHINNSLLIRWHLEYKFSIYGN